MNPFAWIRRKAAESFIQGIADGAASITPEGETPPTTPEELRALFAASVLPKQLAAAKEEEETGPRKRKGG